MADPFALPNGSLTGVAGVVMFVGPWDADFSAPSGVREVAIVDIGHNIIFLRIFGQMAYNFGNELLVAEMNNDILMACHMEVDHASRSLDNTPNTILNVVRGPTAAQFNIFNARAAICEDMSIREHVKRLVQYRRDIHQGHVDPTVDDEDV